MNQNQGIGVSEAPRGTLFHEYQVDDNGILQKVNLIIATGQNNLAMNQTVRQIAQEKAHIGVLETEWQHVASPERIQQLAQARLGMADSASAQLSSFDQLPRRGADAPAPGNSSVHNASAQVPQAANGAPASMAIPVSQTSDPGM